MSNKYLSFVSDEHLLKCISNLHAAYLNKKNTITRKVFYKNKIDTIKLLFDAKFNEIDEEDLVGAEMLRQVDKSINNFIGTFHEELLGGIKGFERGKQSGYDIRAVDDTLFAEIKNKHNTMDSSSQESVFQKLARYADTHKKAKCYWVQIFAKKSFNVPWQGQINSKEYGHSRVHKISGDQFYAMLTGIDDAMMQVYKVLPNAIDEYLSTMEPSEAIAEHSAFTEIQGAAKKAGRTILNQITAENYPYYMGSKEL